MRCIETLSQFIEWASQFNDGHYLFRGVSKSSYKIEASAYRRLITNKTAARLLEVNRELINDARGRGHDQKNGQQLSDLELLAELQHLGAATCLIDFTRSALVALWFACQQSSTKEETNGKVFAVYSDIIARFKMITPGLLKKDIDHFFSRLTTVYIRYINGNPNFRIITLSLNIRFLYLVVLRSKQRRNVSSYKVASEKF